MVKSVSLHEMTHSELHATNKNNRNRYMNKYLCFCLSVCCQLLSFAQNLSTNTTGSFTFIPNAPLNTKPVEIFYHIPAGNVATMPILMSFHGVERNGSDYRNYWIAMANANGFMVFAPEFSEANYPTGDSYQSANIFDDGDNPSPSTYNPNNEWTFSIIDPLFESIKTAVSGTQQVYNAWGHSAGAQFLHRFVMYLPNSKLDVAVCSNAGWYTVPEFSVNFPYGLNNSQLSNATLISAFSKKLIVHLGLNDTDPNAPALRRNSIVDNQQGTHRLVRGRYFFNTSTTTATNMSVPFRWEKHEVAGISHNAQLMANNALQYVLQSSLSTTSFLNEQTIDIFPNPSTNFIYFNNSKLKTNHSKLFNSMGTLVAEYHYKSFSPKQEIDISSQPSGVYFLKLGSTTLKLVKRII